MPFYNRIRLPLYFSKPQFPMERSVFRKADGSRKVLSTIISNTYEGKTDMLPKEWHQKLAIALSHDVVNIESDRLLTEVVLDSEYEIDWQEFLDYPIAQSKFKVQVTPFNASNTNCQTCDEITQLELTDDTTADCFEEGTAGNVFPFSVLDNDNICCYPFTVEISSYNTDYFDAVTVDDSGLVMFTVKDSVPNISNVLLATYRVSCPNGAYDEANIYVCIEGTGTECVAPANLQVELPPTDGTIATLIWDPVVPTPTGYDWVLYAFDDIYTPLQSGSTTDNFVNLTGLVSGESYIFTVQTDCGGSSSAVSMIEFTTPNIDANTCGDFLVTHINSETPQISYYSYMDCVGDIHNESTTGATMVAHCMLMDQYTFEPVFFTTTSTYISITYQGIC